MDYALEKRIGNPDLFVGRKKERGYFLKWIDDINYKGNTITRKVTGKTLTR